MQKCRYVLSCFCVLYAVLKLFKKCWVVGLTGRWWGSLLSGLLGLVCFLDGFRSRLLDRIRCLGSRSGSGRKVDLEGWAEFEEFIICSGKNNGEVVAELIHLEVSNQIGFLVIQVTDFVLFGSLCDEHWFAFQVVVPLGELVAFSPFALALAFLIEGLRNTALENRLDVH